MESVRIRDMAFVMVVAVVMFMQAGKWAAEAQVHHVVGDDRGWDVSSNIASWANDRTFMVGDFLWFAYSGGIDKDNVVELRSRGEFESCDVSNPIVMLTEGIDKVSLQEEGSRYFASSNIENCKKGLKLPVEVKSKSTVQDESLQSSIITKKAGFLAQEPVAPSSTVKIHGSVLMVLSAIIFSHVAL
ncbi:stellacyanin-like [Silene latifolia]|uniref:stellacyanin-like n=1 Tax=Silene latifolia TaxID=37657 RepID=UPI003D789C46